MAVHRIDPQHGLRLFHRLDVEIDRHRLAVAAHQHAFQDLVAAGVDFLMRHVGRNEDEIAGAGLRGELQMLAPAHPRLAPHHIDDAFEMAVVMRAGLGVGLDGHRAGPQFLRAGAGEIDRGLAVHARRRRHVGIELVAGNDADAVMLPAVVVRMVVRMRVSRSLRYFRVDSVAGTVAKLAIRKPADSGTFRAVRRCLGEPLQKENFSWVARQTRSKAHQRSHRQGQAEALAKPPATSACRAKARSRK